MSPDITEIVEPYLSEDPARWAKLASDVQWRRLQLLLLREILLELRTSNSERQEGKKDEPYLEGK